MEANPSAVKWSEFTHAGVRSASQRKARRSSGAVKLSCMRVAFVNTRFCSVAERGATATTLSTDIVTSQ
jgi:hypothetical protein